MIRNDQTAVACPRSFCEFCSRVLKEAAAFLSLPQAMEVSVLLADSKAMQVLNFTYRQKDETTDVLAFPQSEAGEPFYVDDVLILGDIVVNMEIVQEESVARGHSLEQETAFLLVHGFLHLLGYEHGEEFAGEMRDKQTAVLNDLQVFDQAEIEGKEEWYGT